MMTPPISMQCSHPGCTFATPGGIPTYEFVLKSLEIHVTSAHNPSSHQSNQKIEKPKRPELTSGMSESDWVFFQHKWSRYQRQSKISGQQVIDEIWACLDAELERLAF